MCRWEMGQFYIPLLCLYLMSLVTFFFVIYKVTDASKGAATSNASSGQSSAVYVRLGVQLSVMVLVFFPDTVAYLMSNVDIGKSSVDPG